MVISLINIYDQYTEVSEKRITLQKEAVELEKEKVKFYKEKNKIKEELIDQKNKFLLLKKNSENQGKILNDFSIQYNKCIAEFEEYKNKTKDKEVSNKIENRIINLMDKFSDLGVNLKEPNWCDKNYTKRYDMASSILTQISALIKTDSKLEKYYNFVQSNQSSIIIFSRECKPHIIKNI